MTRIVRFLPAVFFLLFWALVVTRGIEMKKAVQLPVTSNQFISTMGQCIGDPWTHNSALRVFFLRLRQVGASGHIWADSLPFGWALWHQYQYAGGIEIMLLIAHESGNRLEERYWARKYMALKPDDPRVHQLLERLRSSRANDVPMEMLGPW